MDAVTHRRFASGDLEKTASIKRLGARLTARAASDTLVILEKGCLKFLYPSSEYPARFELSQTTTFPAGAQLFDLKQFVFVTNQAEMNATTNTVAFASVSGDKLSGRIESRMYFAFANGQEFNVLLKGAFYLQIAN